LKRTLCSTAAIIVAAFLVRIIVMHYYFRAYEEPKVHDDLQFGAETGAVAAAIASGRGFSSPLHFMETGATAWFAPIYLYLLAGVFKLFGVFSYTSNLVIHALNLAFSAFTCWPIRSIGDRAFGKKAGLAAAWIWVVLPSAVYFPVIWVWDTTLTTMWMAMLVAATLALRGSTRMYSWAGYGALWAAGALINPSLLSVLPFLGLWAIWPARKDRISSAKLVLAAAAVFLAGIAPWSVRNYLVFDKFIPLRSNFGLELWLGNNPDVPDTWTPHLHPNEHLPEGQKYARMTEIPYMQEKQREAVAFMRTHPGDVARFMFRRFAYNWLGVWDPPWDLWRTSPLYVKALIIENVCFSLLSLTGLLLASRRGREATGPLATVLLVFPLIFYLTHPAMRYRHPMDPIMLVLAVFAVMYLVSPAARRKADEKPTAMDGTSTEPAGSTEDLVSALR
jgi:4-amino-4-deoxy-L-arabinose transferase-like glycosyltransferase